MKGKRVTSEGKEGKQVEGKRVKDGKDKKSEGVVNRMKWALKVLKEINTKVVQNCW